MTDASPRADAALAALEVEGARLVPPFGPGRLSVACRVPHATPHVRLTVRPRQTGAAVAVAGRAVEAGRPVAVDLAVGVNRVPIEVTAPDGATRLGYEVRITRSHPTPDWVRIMEAAPWAPRDSAGEVVFGGRMWLFGGYTPALVSDVWSSADGAHWQRHGDIPAAAGINIPLTWVHGGRMWVSSQDGRLFASSDGQRWQLVNDAPPWRGRYAPGGAVFADRMWAMGGKGPVGLCGDVWSSPDGVAWRLECAEAPWSRRQLSGLLVVHDGSLWLVGGGVTLYHPFRGYTDVWRSDDGRRWTQVVDAAPWPERIWSSAVSYAGRLWVLGGFRAEPEWHNWDDVWYSADGRDWRRLVTEHVWSPRHELSPYVFDGCLWVVAGNAWPLTGDAWRLRIDGLTFLTQPVVEEIATARYTYRARADFNHSRAPVRYRLLRGPEWLVLDPATGTLTGTPPAPGQDGVALEAGDDAGETARQEFTIDVLPVS